MSEFIQPDSDRSEPGVAEFLVLWGRLLEWQRDQFLGSHGIELDETYPVSALLGLASAAELVLEARNLFAPSSERRGAKRHVVLEWPPRGKLAEIWHEMHAERAAPSRAESA